MTKAPAFQFYVRDWLSDPQLRQASPASRGIWIDLLCFMWEAPSRGKLEGSVENIARMIGVTPEEMTGFLEEVKTLKFADVTFCNKNVTIINRRMTREQKAKENTRLRVQRHREKQACNTNITPSSSSSSSSSCTKVHNSSTISSEIVVGGNSADPVCPHQKIIEIYHETLPELPRVRDWTPNRKKALQVRWKEKAERQDLDWWKNYFQTVKRTPFLTGNNDRSWRADIDFLLKPSKMTAVLEGKYNNLQQNFHHKTLVDTSAEEAVRYAREKLGIKEDKPDE